MSTQDQATQQAAAPVAAESPDTAEPQGAPTVNCRHCGQQKPDDIDVSANPDWNCPACERYQDATVCPTCGGNARISMLPEKMRPQTHEPVRRRKAKE